ncbi:hypothetical protein ACVVFH_003505, partial [Escherichia coli]
QKKSADLVSNKLRIGVFQRYQIKCKSVSKKSPRYTCHGIYHRPGNKLAVCSSSGGKTGIKFSGGGSGDIPVIYS